MAVLQRWIDWRERAKVVTTTTTTVTYAAAGTITRISGSFVADGFEVGMHLTVSAPSSNSDKLFIITAVTATVLTVFGDVTGTSPGSATLTAFHVDADGVPRYPGPWAPTNLVRANGFTGLPEALDGIPYEGDPYEISVNSGAADAVLGTDEYDWYLSQRTDDVFRQWFTLTQKASNGSQSFSSTVTLEHTALATAETGVTSSSITVDAFIRLLRHLHLYVRRRSDGAIQWVHLYDTMIPK